MGSTEMAIADDAFSIFAYRRLATIFKVTTPHRCRRHLCSFGSDKVSMGMCEKTDLSCQTCASCDLMLF